MLQTTLDETAVVKSSTFPFQLTNHVKETVSKHDLDKVVILVQFSKLSFVSESLELLTLLPRESSYSFNSAAKKGSVGKYWRVPG